MSTISPLLLALMKEAPHEYQEIEDEFRYLSRAVDNCWRENGELHPTLVLARLINNSPYQRSPHRLLVLMAACEKREVNGRVLLRAMQYLGRNRFTASADEIRLLREASNTISRWCLLHGASVSFGSELDRELSNTAEQLRKHHGLPAI